MGGPCGTHWGEERRIQRLVVKPEGRRTLGIHRRRWEDNIKMDIEEIVLGSVEWIYVVENWNRWRGFVNTTVTLRGVSWIADQLSALCTLSTVWKD
jgi:hypothetical protein